MVGMDMVSNVKHGVYTNSPGCEATGVANARVCDEKVRKLALGLHVRLF